MLFAVLFACAAFEKPDASMTELGLQGSDWVATTHDLTVPNAETLQKPALSTRTKNLITVPVAEVGLGEL